MGRSNASFVSLPTKPFFYTIDQIAFLLSLDEAYVRRTLLFYEGRSVGVRPKDKILAINLAPDGEKPEWRVNERHLIQYMRFKGLKYHERGYVD